MTVSIWSADHSVLDYNWSEEPTQEHEQKLCSSLPMKWSEGQRTADENAPTAALGCPNLKPGIFPADISTKNLTFGTLVKAFPYKQTPSHQNKNNKNTILTPTLYLFLHSRKSSR